MKKNPNIRTIEIGMRTLHVIEGLPMKNYIPEAIIDKIHSALADQDMEWSDVVISKSTMVIGSRGHVSVLYKHEPIRFNGLLLFTFCQDSKNEHCFGFSKKGNHIEYYT